MAGAFTDERLIEAWGRIDGIAAVARELETTYAAVAQRAMRLKLKGVPLRRMPRTPRAGVTIARAPTAESLGIDPEELRELLEAYRAKCASMGSVDRVGA